MKIIRWILGRIILVVEFVMTPKGVKRDKSLQQKIDEEMRNLSIYQFKACPFCVKVRHVLKKQNLNIELRDAKNNDAYRKELEMQGGKVKVPCLRIEKAEGEVDWIYESDEIIRYLEQRVSLT